MQSPVLSKKKLAEACRKIDIAEQDVYEIDDSIAFGYFYNIRTCYLYTMADPYWYGEFERTNVPRAKWKTKKIPWNALFLVWE